MCLSIHVLVPPFVAEHIPKKPRANVRSPQIIYLDSAHEAGETLLEVSEFDGFSIVVLWAIHMGIFMDSWVYWYKIHTTWWWNYTFLGVQLGIDFYG